MAKSRTGAWRWTRVGGRRRSIRASGSRRALVVPSVPESEPLQDTKRNRRQLSELEVQSRTDFDEMEAQLEKGIITLLNGWRDIKRRHIAELSTQIRKADGDVVKLAKIQPSLKGDDLLFRELRKIAQAAGTAALQEAAAQGVNVVEPNTSAVQGYLERRAEAAALLLARSLGETAARQAVRMASPNQTPNSLAAAVREHLEGLSDAFLRDSFNALLVGGVNLARRTVFDGLQKGTYYSSAVLDRNTCPACRKADGKRYSSLLGVEAEFPFGGRADCRGRLRCRCTVIAVWSNAT